jgi:hypothetical protein
MKILNKIMCVIGWITSVSVLLIAIFIGIAYLIATVLGVSVLLLDAGAKIFVFILTAAVIAGIIALIIKLASGGNKNRTRSTGAPVSSYSESIYKF